LPAFLAVLFSPFNRRVWAFGRDVRSRLEFLGIGSTRIREWQPIGRSEIRRGLPQRRLAFRTASDTSDSDRCTLALVDMDDADLIAIQPLTEGDARWIAGEIRTEFGRCFDRRHR